MKGVIDGLRDRPVIVTGGRGYIGSCLAQALARAGAQVLSLDRRGADVRARETWDAIVQAAPLIFHLAGTTSHTEAAGSLESTVMPVRHLIDAAKAAGRHPRVVFASTATVYGLAGVMPVDEDTPASPITVYDAHKLAAEGLLAGASEQGLIDAVSLRCANVYGPSPRASAARDRGVLNRAARQALSAGDLQVFGDGRYLRDYVYIDDVVRAFTTIATTPVLTGRVFNVGSGRGVAVGDAFALVAAGASRMTQTDIRVRTVPWPPDTHPIERRNFTASIARLTAACGWVPSVGIEEGVERLLEYVAHDRSSLSCSA
ncbi:MAG TPA: SDR family oxidoreductase [Vicinamibacterales bacterium]|nr:SDR family oxidoreductase [Vicinamibacterales bacterium]